MKWDNPEEMDSDEKNKDYVLNTFYNIGKDFEEDEYFGVVHLGQSQLQL